MIVESLVGSIFLATTTNLPDIPVWMISPFVVMLLSIALLPLLAASFWEHHYQKVSLGLAAFTALCYLFILGDGISLLQSLREYFSFICLVGSLFVVAGGILITVKGESTPFKNVLFLAVGAVMANVIGTTGASMLLIRPWIKTNRYRFTRYHTAFFIFIISNVAGCLTPIGDPPLFIGYLKHIPFCWTVTHLWKPWLLAVGMLLAIFYVFDSGNFLRALKKIREKETGHEVWRFGGKRNLLLLGVVLAAVFINYPPFVRELIMILAAVTSYVITGKQIHEENHFTFQPIKEVSWLFFGIFITMVPTLQYLERHSAELGITKAWQFYWMAGSLSSVLDNAPTYLTFLASLLGLNSLSVENGSDVLWAVGNHPVEIMAISTGAVFFGAMTYIGNGPNLMVKSIADRAGVHTPSFFSYILRFAIPVLLPVLLLVGLIWFR